MEPARIAQVEEHPQERRTSHTSDRCEAKCQRKNKRRGSVSKKGSHRGRRNLVSQPHSLEANLVLGKTHTFLFLQGGLPWHPLIQQVPQIAEPGTPNFHYRNGSGPRAALIDSLPQQQAGFPIFLLSQLLCQVWSPQTLLKHPQMEEFRPWLPFYLEHIQNSEWSDT